MHPIQAAIVIVSDKSSRGEREDASGPLLQTLLSPVAQLHSTVILPDERDALSAHFIQLADTAQVDIVFTSGGTGFAPRDTTPEATLAVVDRLAPGIPEAMRAYSMQKTNRAMLSRAVAGIRGHTLIINLPGSPKAVRECMEVVLPIMEHAVETLRGDTYECGKT